ncbi:unnamed protein product, partial [Pelagomonas calceolata]
LSRKLYTGGGRVRPSLVLAAAGRLLFAARPREPCRASRRRRALGRNPRDDFPSNSRERLRHVDVVLRGRLQELDLVLGRERGALRARDAPLGLVVALVRHEHPIDLRVRVVRDLRHPAPYRIKRPPVRDVVDEHDALRAPKIGPRDGPELLLARRVPDLQLHPPPVQIHGLDLEIDADRRDERRTERVVRVAQQQRGLADGAVADHQQLDLQIKRPRRRHGRATRGNAPKE